jgi:hypothetical protein
VRLCVAAGNPNRTFGIHFAAECSILCAGSEENTETWTLSSDHAPYVDGLAGSCHLAGGSARARAEIASAHGTAASDHVAVDHSDTGDDARSIEHTETGDAAGSIDHPKTGDAAGIVGTNDTDERISDCLDADERGCGGDVAILAGSDNADADERGCGGDVAVLADSPNLDADERASHFAGIHTFDDPAINEAIADFHDTGADVTDVHFERLRGGHGADVTDVHFKRLRGGDAILVEDDIRDTNAAGRRG